MKKLVSLPILAVTFAFVSLTSAQSVTPIKVNDNSFDYTRDASMRRPPFVKGKGKDRDLTLEEKKELSDEEKEYKSKRKQIQEKLIRDCKVELG